MFRAPVLLCAAVSLGSAQYLISTVAGGVPPITPAAAITLSIGDPPRVAVDSAGNFYFGSLHSIFKVDPSGAMTRIAGTGRAGITGDGGPAISAQLNYPLGIAVDPQGNVYYTERDANIIRKISTAGTISTFAGAGPFGYLGDGGPATAAWFRSPTGLAADAAGNLYVADTGNDVIRRIAVDGAISTVAGNNIRGYCCDGASALAANLSGPEGVAVDAAGNLYIADTLNSRIRMVSKAGIITTFAANGFPGFSGESSPAGSATLFLPTDIVVDKLGAVYVADLGNSRIRKIDSGTLSTIAGSVHDQTIADGQPAVAIRLSGPTGLAVDSTGAVYFVEGGIGTGSGLTVGDFRVWKVTPDGMVHAVAGNGSNSFSGDTAAATTAQLNTPAGVAFDTAGNLYFADSQNHRVRKISPRGVITTVAGNASLGFSGDGGQATAAQLNTPLGVAIDAFGNLFIADSANNRIRKVFPNGIIGTVAGNGNAAFFGDGSNALTAALHAPASVAVDLNGNVFVADTLDHRIRVIRGDGTIDTVVGRGQGSTGDGGQAIEALLNRPASVAVDAAGNLYIADQGNGRVRKVTASTGIVSTIAGGEQGASPRGVAVDGAGNVFYADTGLDVVRRISAADASVVTIAGTGQCCYDGDGGVAAAAKINQPWGVAADPGGSVFFADAGNNAIRVAAPSTTTAFIRAVVNSASNAPGALAPGEIVSIYGAGIGPAIPAAGQADSGILPTQIAGYSVSVNGIAAPLLYASAGQVSAIIPYGVSSAPVQVSVRFQSQVTTAASLPLAAAAPGIFTADSSGTGQARALNGDGSLNSASRPAPAGSSLTVYATGEGQTSPEGIDGRINGTSPPHPSQTVTATIGGKTANVQSSGGVPGSPAGLMQFLVQVPAGVNGAVPIVLTVGGVASQTNVTVSVVDRPD